MVTGLDWQGQVGREWADKADALDALLNPVGRLGMDALGDVAGQRVLDLGCGAGQTCLQLAERGAIVTGADISPDLMAAARARDDHGRCRFVLGDAAAIDLGGPFEAIYSRCGAMFFEHPVQAWAQLRAQADEDCALSVICWRAQHLNAWADLPLAVARPVLGDAATRPLPVGAPGPFAWAEREIFEPILTRAGWRELRCQPVQRTAPISMGMDPDPVARAVLFFMRVGPLAGRLREVAPDLRAQVAQALYRQLQDHVQDGAVQLTTSAWIIQART
jgi:SAM-dependent methyltransferase